MWALYSDMVGKMKQLLLILVFFLINAPVAFSQPVDRQPIGPEVELPDDLQQLTIAEEFVSSDAEAVGHIQTAIGHVVVLHADKRSAYVATGGDPLFKEDVVFTLADSRCRIQFSTEDLITMGADTRVGIEAFIDSAETGEKSSIVKILRGKAMFYVFRLFRYRKISSTVHTPTAIVGVRGTKFGTEVRVAKGLEASASPRYLADASGSMLLSQAASAQPELETVVHCFEGTVEVFSPADGIRQMVTRGKSLEVTALGARDVRITPPDVARQFALETEAPAPEDAEDQGGGDQGEADPGQSDTSETEASLTEDTEETESAKAGGTEDVAQTQTIITVEEEAANQAESTGYIAAMLTRSKDGSKSFQHLYISDKRQDFSAGKNIQARDALGGSAGNPLLLNVDGGDGSDLSAEKESKPRLVSVDVNLYPGVEEIAGPFTITDVLLGKTDYMEWGRWIQPELMTSPSGASFLVDNGGYYVFGRTTTDSEISDFAANSKAGTYSGKAHGTYWTGTGGADMAGAFSADVDFGKKEVSNFGVSVTGNGHQVNISGVKGAFQGSSSQFALDPNTSGSVWQIDGQNAPAGKKEAYGSVYGPSGEKIGGVWKLDAPAGQGEAHATGMFEGSR